MRRRIVEREDGVPKRHSLIGNLMHKHGVSASDGPIPEHRSPEQIEEQRLKLAEQQAARHFKRLAQERRDTGILNLTDLADKYGTDKGSEKHRYTELYHLLLSPRRNAPLKMLEMGLQIGGPEHGEDADRETTDLPSIRMWLDYFPEAEMVGLDVSDFSKFELDRFRFIRCDMDKRENIAEALENEDDFDVILDDASHASHHQQFGFLELFPKLKAGGIYIIEDLRWQPEGMEREDFPATAKLFEDYLRFASFSHPDPDLEAEFNALRTQFSGVFLFEVNYVPGREHQVAVIHKR